MTETEDKMNGYKLQEYKYMGTTGIKAYMGINKRTVKKMQKTTRGRGRGNRYAKVKPTAGLATHPFCMHSPKNDRR